MNRKCVGCVRNLIEFGIVQFLRKNPKKDRKSLKRLMFALTVSERVIDVKTAGEINRVG